MALRYFLEYNDYNGGTHRLEIYDDDFSGDATRIDGLVNMEYSQADDLLDPIKGMGLRVELEANADLTFDTLYSEYERDFLVHYKRNGDLKFRGWINPEGWYEDFVASEWKVSFDCIDGLSFLNHFSYVDGDGERFTSQQTALEVIAECLRVTGLKQDIKADVGLVYSGLSESSDILANLKIDPIRYVKDDGGTIMSCREVLSSVLDLLTACVISMDGEWYIYRPNQIYSSATFSYFHYDYQGTAESPATGTKTLTFALGSESEGFFPHHCSGNQSIRNKKSLGALRTNYKYGIKRGLLENIYLESDGTTIDDYTRDNTDYTTIPANKKGIILSTYPLGPSGFTRKLYSDNMTLQLGDRVNFTFKFYCNIPYSATSSVENFRYKLKLTQSGGGTVYYYAEHGSWQTSDYTIEKQVSKVSQAYITSIDLEMPNNGDLTVEFWTPEFDVSNPIEYECLIYEVAFTALEEQEDDIEGEIHTFIRSDAPNSKIDSVKELFNGDNDSSIYVGALFQANGTSLTSQWNRKGVTESKEILYLMGYETLRLKQSTQRIFSGNVYGYFDYLSRVSIDGVSGVFMPSKWSFNTQSNIISAEFKQIFGDELTDVDYFKTIDMGEVTDPTIAAIDDEYSNPGDVTKPLTGTLNSVSEQ